MADSFDRFSSKKEGHKSDRSDEFPICGRFKNNINKNIMIPRSRYWRDRVEKRRSGGDRRMDRPKETVDHTAAAAAADDDDDDDA